MRTNDYDQWVHFYEDAYKIERLWNNPRRYIGKLKRFNGLISPDFSLYRDMPLVMQQWNTYRGKAIGHWWQSLGLTVLPNVRYSDERSYEFCCNGVHKHSIICVGSYGNLRLRENKHFFKLGLRFIVHELEPSGIVVYGAAPDDIFSSYVETGIRVVPFESEFSKLKKGRML